MWEKSSGQGQVTQLGVLSSGEPPGQPEKVITRSMPSFSARRTVLTKSSWNTLATAGSGCTALPCVDSAAISRPCFSMVFLNSAIFLSSLRSSSGLQCALPGKPPLPISTACTPESARYLQASSRLLSARRTAKTESFIGSFPPFPSGGALRHIFLYYTILFAKTQGGPLRPGGGPPGRFFSTFSRTGFAAGEILWYTDLRKYRNKEVSTWMLRLF